MGKPYHGQWKAKCPQPQCPGSVYKKGKGAWVFFQCNYCAEVWDANDKVIRLVAKLSHNHLQLIDVKAGNS